MPRSARRPAHWGCGDGSRNGPGDWRCDGSGDPGGRGPGGRDRSEELGFGVHRRQETLPDGFALASLSLHLGEAFLDRSETLAPLLIVVLTETVAELDLLTIEADRFVALVQLVEAFPQCRVGLPRALEQGGRPFRRQPSAAFGSPPPPVGRQRGSTPSCSDSKRASRSRSWSRSTLSRVNSSTAPASISSFTSSFLPRHGGARSPPLRIAAGRRRGPRRPPRGEPPVVDEGTVDHPGLLAQQPAGSMA